MKKYLSLMLGAALLLSACSEKDKDPVLQIGSAPSITAPAANSTYVILDSTLNETFAAFSWSAATFGFDAAIAYTLEMDKAGNNFAAPLAVGTINALSLEGVTNDKINNLLLAKDLPAGESADVEFRVVAKVSPDVDLVYSAPVTLKITPFQVVVNYPRLQVPGSYQGWKPEDLTTVILSANSDNKYEGFINFTGADIKYKYTEGLTWAVNWGDNGGDGTLESGGADIPLAEEGFYRLNVDLNALTHSNLKTTWGAVGSATGSWDIDQPLVYDPATQKLSATLDLVVGEIKFRANNAWDINFGDNGANKSLEYGGDNIAVAEAGNYTIELSLVGVAKYTYKLTKN